MPSCPICDRPLETVRQREGLYYPCPACSGRAMTLSQIRHVLGDRIATKLLRLIKLSRGQTTHPCPFCSAPMMPVKSQEPLLELESCRACAVVWFDQPTYESLPQLTDETMNSRRMQATEIIALNRLKELKEKEEAERERQRKKKPRHRLLGPRDDPDEIR